MFNDQGVPQIVWGGTLNSFTCLGALEFAKVQFLTSFFKQLKQTMNSQLKTLTSKPEPIIEYNVDWGFIRNLEGFSNKGYVPTDKMGKAIGQSGVTIGTGFDLGQHSEQDLVNIGVPNDLIQVLHPYLGKRKNRH